ncbi:MAG: hypothetical protein N2Z65_01505 [Clostridiales bacterium]|nr:hypothetical protein [Clostridiales bacterium]
MNRNRNPFFELFMKTGLPEAYMIYSKMNNLMQDHEKDKKMKGNHLDIYV